MMMGNAVPAEEADYIIAGGGSAGCVLASRLSEDSGKRVVLLEAGPSSDLFWVKVPAGIAYIMPRPDLNWFYATEPDPTLLGRSIMWNSGKMLGGGSAINGMVYIRGARQDYDAWAKAGCAGWSWDEVLPYYKKSEDFEGPASPYHGKGGPLAVSRLRIVHPLTGAFLAACNEIGMPTVEDYGSGDIDGAFVNVATQGGGERCSAYRGFLQPVLKRPNLTVITGATVDRVLFEGRRAAGVRFRQDGAVRELRCRAEVVISAGTIQSPAILLRSGIGPGAQLRAFGVEMTAEANGVGKNLHEHPSLPTARAVRTPTYNVRDNPLGLALEGLKFFAARRGLLTTCPVHAMAHGRTSPGLELPDVKIQWMPMWGDPARRAGPQAGEPERPRPDSDKVFGVTVNINLMTPKSRGEIRLRSADPMDKPVIDWRMYDDPSDLERMREAMKFGDRIFAAPALARHVAGPAFPPRPNPTDAEWEDLLRRYSQVGYHPVGTCRMGGDADPGAVLDPQLRVRGVEGLRVADASIMPVLPLANTNAPAIMIGEKAADLIKEDARIPPRMAEARAPAAVA
jgi:choline dehydrogenase